MDDVLAILQNRRQGLYRSPREIDAASRPPAYAHAVTRAMKDLACDAVLYSDGFPRAFLKRVKRFAPSDIRGWHRVLWNHAVTPILVLFSDTEIRVYSGRSLPARPDEEIDAGFRRVEASVLDATRLALELEQKLVSIETGEIFAKSADSFNREAAVDAYLLENLIVLAEQLSEVDTKRPLTPTHVQRFLIQVIFTCYAIEREMVTGKLFKEDPILGQLSPEYGLRELFEEHPPAAAGDVLFKVFARFKTVFNGTIFAGSLSDQRRGLNAEHMGLLRRFLAGESLKSGQRMLGFWAYEFKHIPIETISCIYEGFLKFSTEKEDELGDKTSSGGSTKKQGGVYYTPPVLAETVIDMALTDGETPLLESRVLDPACGSGAFLVAVFNRMAHEWQRANPTRRNSTRAKALRELLQTQIVGMDKEIAACEITCFSLYLAFLDQLTPSDVFELHKALGGDSDREEGVGVLPNLLLREGDRQRVDDPRTVVCRNFFDAELSLPVERFDLIVGNPPWVSRENVRDRVFLKWRDSKGKDDNVYAPQKEMSCGFAWRCLDLLGDGGIACLLLPAAVLMNDTAKSFQRRFFGEATVDRVVNFADLHHFLFKDAKRPCIAVRYGPLAESTETDDTAGWVRYETPRADTESRQGGPVHVFEDDMRWVRVNEIMGERRPYRAWKDRLWGTERDLRLLQRLDDLPRLREHVALARCSKPRRWIEGQGFQPYSATDEAQDATKHHAWWKPTDRFLEATDRFDFVVLPEEHEMIRDRFRELRRLPPERLFRNPKVIVAQGTQTLKVGFCESLILFRHSLQAIAGPKEDAPLLRFLTAVLNSRFAEYYLFHTSANQGVERRKTLFKELLELPFPLPEQLSDPREAENIVGEVNRHLDGFEKAILQEEIIGKARDDAADELRLRLETLIRAYYEISDDDAVLIEDTLAYFKPSCTPSTVDSTRVPALRRPRENDREVYVSLFCKTLNGFRGEKTGVFASGSSVVDEESGLGIVIVEQTRRQREYSERIGFVELLPTLTAIGKLLRRRRGTFEYHRGLKIAVEGKLYLIKPLRMKAWTRTAALNDADEAFGALATRRWGGE